jgi:hypothetical protein
MEAGRRAPARRTQRPWASAANSALRILSAVLCLTFGSTWRISKNRSLSSGSNTIVSNCGSPGCPPTHPRRRSEMTTLASTRGFCQSSWIRPADRNRIDRARTGRPGILASLLRFVAQDPGSEVRSPPAFPGRAFVGQASARPLAVARRSRTRGVGVQGPRSAVRVRSPFVNVRATYKGSVGRTLQPDNFPLPY